MFGTEALQRSNLQTYIVLSPWLTATFELSRHKQVGPVMGWLYPLTKGGTQRAPYAHLSWLS